MRRELTAALGVEWGPMHEDAAEIAGIPARVLRAFSRRHEQIAEWLDAAGESGPAAAATAQRATRQAKQVPADFAAVEAAWHARADTLGWGPAQLEQLLASVVPAVARSGYVVEDVTWRAGVRQVSSRMVGFDEWLDWLLDTRVTAHDATFTRLDLTRAIASALPASTSVDVVETTVQRALASTAIVAVGDHWDQRAPVHAPCRVVPDDRSAAVHVAVIARDRAPAPGTAHRRCRRRRRRTRSGRGRSGDRGFDAGSRPGRRGAGGGVEG